MNWVICEELKPHADKVLQYKIEDNNIKLLQVQINYNKAWYLIEKGEYQSAQHVVLQALEIRQELSGADSPETLATEGLLVSTFWNQGRWKEAEELEVQVIETSLRVLGAEHPSTLTSIANLVSTYRNQG